MTLWVIVGALIGLCIGTFVNRWLDRVAPWRQQPWRREFRERYFEAKARRERGK